MPRPLLTDPAAGALVYPRLPDVPLPDLPTVAERLGLDRSGAAIGAS